ncbi:MAG: hypothetical protein RL533_1277 [Pseudomonadota bacterium]
MANEIASSLNQAGSQLKLQEVDRAAQLAKADLLTEMVGEFPELQGVMGRYYALANHEAPDVAAACYEHYLPRYAGDSLPQTLVGTVLAIADKLETIIGIWGVGLAPTGDKDPYALRLCTAPSCLRDLPSAIGKESTAQSDATDWACEAAIFKSGFEG